MSLFNTFTLPVIRKEPGDYSDASKGHWVDGTEINFNVKGSWQPINGEQMMVATGGKYTEAGYVLFTDTELNPTENKTPSDLIVYEGFNYQVVKCEKWDNGLLPHYRIYAVKSINIT